MPGPQTSQSEAIAPGEATHSGGAPAPAEASASTDVLAESSSATPAAPAGGGGEESGQAQVAEGQGSRSVPYERFNEVIRQRNDYESRYNDAVRQGAGGQVRQPGAQSVFDEDTDKAVRQLAGETFAPQVRQLQQEYQNLKLERLGDRVQKLDGWTDHGEGAIALSERIISSKTGEVDFELLAEALVKAEMVDKGVYERRHKEEARKMDDAKGRAASTTGAATGGEPEKPKPRSEWTFEQRAAERQRNMSRMRG